MNKKFFITAFAVIALIAHVENIKSNESREKPSSNFYAFFFSKSTKSGMSFSPLGFAAKHKNETAFVGALAYKNRAVLANVINTAGSKVAILGNKIAPRATAVVVKGVNSVVDATGKFVGLAKASSDKVLSHIGTNSDDALNALANGTMAIISADYKIFNCFTDGKTQKRVLVTTAAAPVLAATYSRITGKEANLSKAVNIGAAFGYSASLSALRGLVTTTADYLKNTVKGAVIITVNSDNADPFANTQA